MKKSNYLHLLKELQAKKGIEVLKTFKNAKKNTISHNSRNSNPKTKERRILPKDRDVFESQKLQDKQNEHPNMIKLNKRQLNPTPKPLVPQRRIRTFNHQANTIEQCCEDQRIKDSRIQSKQFAISLSKCNFEPSHESSNLFLVETQNSSELIVCEQCSKKFLKKTPLNSFSHQKPKYSYGQLVGVLQQLEQKNKKLGRVMLMQRESITRTIDQVRTYYGELIRVILEKRDELENVLIEAYNNNEAIISSLMRKNNDHISLVNRVIEEWQKRCAQGKTYHQIQEASVLEEIDQIIEQLPQNHQIQLSCISQQIPIQILNEFQKDFTESKYCITLRRNFSEEENQEQKHEMPMIDPILQQLEETYPEEQEQNYIPNNEQDEQQNNPYFIKNKADMTPDYQNMLPFTVEYSLTSQKPANFSHKMDDHLSKISSSEQLLIDSLRNHQSYPKLNTNLSTPLINVPRQQNQLQGPKNNTQKYEKDQAQNQLNNLGKVVNFRTESSTCRTLPPENSCGKQNFIKQLHVDHDDFADLMCDQDLTLSSSHPIHQNPKLPRKSLKLSYKRNEHPLTLEQLNSELSQPQKLPQILNPSIISANENKNEISFELDQNMLIDANILPTQEIDQENLDIISPAFKII